MHQTVDLMQLIKQMESTISEFEAVKQKMLSQENLNASTIYLISIIGDDVLTLKEVTERAQLDKSTVSRQINTLEKLQLVERKTGEDKRFSFFKLTEDAYIHYNSFLNKFTNYIENALMAWSEEEKQMLLVLLGRMEHSLRQADK